MRRSIAAAAVVAALLLAPASAGAAAPAFHDHAGLHVVSQRRLDARLSEVRVTTSALPGPATVRILLPTRYDRSRRYPVLYLLHGTSGGAADWTQRGDAERTTAGRPLIVVMPDIALHRDGGGWCADWYNAGAYGLPKWETFHIDQLIPWVDANLPTVANRGGRAIAGLSQGGFCSTSYAARHPDLFATTLAYSGAPDIDSEPDIRAGSTAIVNAIEVGLDGVPANSIFGGRATQALNWAAHDPATLAGPNLRHTRILLYTGNGVPGPLDTGPPDSAAMSIEGLVERSTTAFHDRLDALGIPHRFDDYGPGTHSWPYWARDLRESIGPVMRAFAHPPRAPGRVSYTSTDDNYAVYGWTVAMHRTAREWSTLKGATTRGFALAGSGSATVTTPRSYRPGARYTASLRGDTVRRTARLVAGADRRLRVVVPLGPPNPFQAETAAALAAGTRVFTTTVAIAPARRGHRRA